MGNFSLAWFSKDTVVKKRCPRVHNEEEQLIEKKERKQGKLELNDAKDQRKKYSVIHCFAVFT